MNDLSPTIHDGFERPVLAGFGLHMVNNPLVVDVRVESKYNGWADSDITFHLMVACRHKNIIHSAFE